MRERKHIPTEEEYKDLDRLFKAICKDKPLRLYMRGVFADFLRPTELRTDTLSRLMAKPSAMQDRMLTAAAYDFALDRLGDAVEKSNSANADTKDFVKIILEDLNASRKRRLGGMDNFGNDVEDHLNLSGHIQPINQSFLGDYFGYRRSSTLGEIVRFTFKISKSNGLNKVSYKNEYMRGGMHWRVHGSGYCVKDTLYLFGHAENANDSNSPPESLGLRFLALRMLWETPCLNGLVISMASEGMPIAARVILVPMEDHILSDELIKMKRLNRQEWETHMIRYPPDYCKDVIPQIGHIFERKPSDYFLELIRNGTTSVLQSTPLDNTIIARREENIRQYCINTDQEINNVMTWRYENFLEKSMLQLDPNLEVSRR